MILLTGFEPFGGMPRNPSGEIAQALSGGDIEGAVLPVDYTRIGPALDALLARRWDAVVLLGVAIKRSAFSLETTAVNKRDLSRTDNALRAPDGRDVVADGPPMYLSTLPLAEMYSAAAEAGFPVELSQSAGEYLCNTSFYLARHATGDLPCGFIHIPPTPDIAKGGAPLPLDDQVRGVGAMLDCLGQ